MSKAIQNEVVVEFEYKKLDAKAYEKRTVEPWHLACVAGQWYLLGYDQTREARRIFVLARRMRNVCSGKGAFSVPRPGEVDLQKLFQNSFQIWQTEDAKLLQIVLCFSGRAAQLVRERNWHPSQRIQESTDGTLELRLTLNSLEEIIPWILSWGRNCRVISPAILRKKVNSVAMVRTGGKRRRRVTISACLKARPGGTTPIVAIRRAIACSWRAWHEVPGKAPVEWNRPVGYGMIGHS